MIFKTFNSDIDKWTAKIGIFGKSFNDFIEASNKRKIVIDDLFTINGVPLKDAKKQAGSFWSYLFPKKEDIQNQLIDVMPEINIANVSDATERIKVMASAVSEGKTSWQNLFDTLPEGEKHFAQLGQQMEGQIITEEGLIKANQEARASALAHNEAIKAQTLSAKAGTVVLKAFSIAGNMLAFWAISKGIQFVVSVFDNYIHRVEKAKESWNTVKSELQEVETELQNNIDKIKELEGLSNPTWADKEELNRLREVTRELELQKQLKQDAQLKSAEDLYEANKSTFDKEFKSSYGTASVEDLKQQLYSGDIGVGQLNLTDNVTDILASIQYLNEEKKKLTDESEIARYDDFIEDLTESIKDKGSDYLSSLSQYKQNILEIASVRDLTEDEQAFYDYLTSMQKMIYEFYSPATWNSLEFDSIFDTKELEKTKEELIAMAKAGELSPEVLQSYPKLNNAIKESSIIAGEGSDKFKEFYNEIMALADKSSNIAGGINKTPLSFSLTESQSKSIDDFQSKVKTLSDTLTSINNGTFEPSDITDLLQEFPELAGKTDNLQGAIQNLIYTLLNKLYKTLGQNIPPELENALQAMADKAASGIKTMSEAISDIQSSYDLMQTVSEEISNGGISASTLQNITDKYPQLENAVNAYCASLLTEQELYEQLETQYQKDYEAFQAANQAKIYENELFFEMSYEKNGELVNALAKKYKLDLDNFKTVEDAKLLGETKLLGKLSSMWSDYYNIILGEDGLYHIQQLNSGYVIENDVNYIALEETRLKMQEFLNDLNESFDLGNLGLDDISWNTGRLDKSSASDPAKDTAEIFDWLEIKIASCTEALEKYTDVRNNAFTAYGARNDALAKEIGQTQELLTLQETAARKYEEHADSFGLSDYYKQLVQSGAVVIEPIDETLKEQIQNYKTWYDKAHESKKAVEELKRSLSELAQTNFNMITSEFEDVLSAFETRATSINNAISLTEAKGYAVSTRYYQALMEDETENISLLKKEHESLTKSLNEAVNSGRIKEGSEAWYDMHSSIADVRNAIEESNLSLVEFRNTIRELKWDAFDRLQDAISQITDESEFIIDLFSDMEMFDDKGGILNTGLAAAGQHAVNYNVLMAQADDYADEYNSVMKELADDPYNQTLIDRTRELAQAQRDAIKSAQDEKQALIELAREGIQKEIDAMQKLVDIKKKMLDTDTSLYEYEQDIAKQSENIASIEKQIAAVQGDNSEENMKRLQQLNKELADAQKQLEETEYDRWKSDQQDMLDEMMSEYEELQNERMNETEKLFREYIATVNANSDTINSTVTQTTEALGYTLSGEMQEIWNAQSMQNGEYRSVVSGYCDGFENRLTSVNEVLNGIKEANREAMDRLNSEAASTTSGIANVGRKIEELAQALLNAASRNSASTVMSDNLNNGNGSSNAAPDNASSPAARESTNDGIPNIGDKVYAKGKWYGDSNGGGAESNVDILKPSYYRIAHIASPGAKYGYNIQGYDENNNPTRGNGWVNLDQLIGYAKGTKKAAKDFAWTQENGGEIIRTSDGALLTPVKDGMVFSNEASRRLWEIANGKGEFPEQFRELFAFPSYNIPQPPVMNNNVNTSNVNNGDVNITMEMNLPNVTNAKEFENQLIRTMQDSSRVKKCINSFTVDIAAGKHPMAYNRF